MADITSVDTLVSATLFEKSVWLWSMHERLAALEERIRPNPAVTAPDPYELAAHWRDKAGEALNRAEKAEAAAAQAIDERDVWVRDCKAAEARAEKVERHDKAMSEEVVRLRKELDQAELAREAAEAEKADLERLKRGEPCPVYGGDVPCIIVSAEEWATRGNLAAAAGRLADERDAAERDRDQYKQSHDTLERLKRGEIVGQDRLVHYSQETLTAAKFERDALAAKLQAELVNKSDLQAKITELKYDLCESDAWLERRTKEVADLERRLAEATEDNQGWITVRLDELAALRRDSERWRWVEKNCEWRPVIKQDRVEWIVRTKDVGHSIDVDVDAAIAAEAVKEDERDGQ